jgi:mRNA-degrading endonuclease RelE of RelBE toxin-antitoxin system
VTKIGTGGVVIKRWAKSRRFHKDYEKLTIDLRDTVDQKLQDLCKDPRPPGLGFEKLKGADGIYTIHITGNYKISMNIEGSDAFLRRVGSHDEIDRAP